MKIGPKEAARRALREARVVLQFPDDPDLELKRLPKRKRAPNGTFDRKAYQRELMRKRRARLRSP